MNKKQLQNRAKELEIPFDDDDTNKVLETKIAEKEEALKKGNVEEASKQEEKNASNQSGGSLENEGGSGENDPADKNASNESGGSLDETPKPPVGIVTTSSFDTSDPVPEEDDDDEDDEPHNEPVKAAEPQTPEVDSDEVLLKYKGTSNTYQISQYRFSKSQPFQVVPKEFADSIGDDHSDLKVSSKEEAAKFYND